MTNADIWKNEIVHQVCTKTQQDIIQWEYDHQFGYVAVAEAVEFRVICARDTNQIGVNGIYITVSKATVQSICMEIAKQSERIRAKKIVDQLQGAGMLKPDEERS
jgi:hypothetical protein